MTIVEHKAETRAEAPEALPWRWFEFRQTPVPVRLPVVHDPQAVYAIALDGHSVPFKFFRRPPSNRKPRPVLMLLHGMGLTIATFRGVAHHLWASHDLILPDYSGLSLDHTALPDFASVKAMAASVWRVADALHIQRLSLAGNSLGGGLSLMAALMAPERVDRLLLANPACFPQPLPGMYRQARVPLWGELLMSLTGPARLVGGVEHIGYVDPGKFSPVLRGIYMDNLRTRRNRWRLMQLIRQLPANASDTADATHLPRLPTIRQPVLITFGLEDPLLVEGAGERLAAALPNATYDPHPDLAHMPHEEAPDRVGPRWAAFLNGI